MHFPPFFYSLSIIFFPNMLFGHILVIWVKQKNMHPCQTYQFILRYARACRRPWTRSGTYPWTSPPLPPPRQTDHLRAYLSRSAIYLLYTYEYISSHIYLSHAWDITLILPTIPNGSSQVILISLQVSIYLSAYLLYVHISS